MVHQGFAIGGDECVQVDEVTNPSGAFSISPGATLTMGILASPATVARTAPILRLHGQKKPPAAH